MSRKLLRSTFTVSSMTLLSRISGFVRDVLYARLFGASIAMDAFLIAFKIPNFFRRLFAEGAFNQAFIPVLSEYKNKRDAESLQQLVNRVAGSLGVILTVITILGMLGAPLVVMLFAPGAYLHSPEKYRMATELLRYTFPYLLFISLTALSGSILNTMGKFSVPAFTPVLLNVCMIAAALWLSPHMADPIAALGWGVFLAGVVQLAFQIPFLRQVGLLPRFKVDFKDPGVQRIKKLLIPALFGVSVSQINVLLDLMLASFLVNGSISWLYYSDRLMEFPLGVFGVALATVILPALSSEHANQDPAAFSRTLDWALRLAIVIAIPAGLSLMVISGPLVATLFQSEAFTAQDVLMSSYSLMAFSAGMVGFILIKVLAPGYFARQDTKTPVKIGIIAMFANMVFNLLLAFPLGHAGLALATSLASLINAGLLYRGLRRSGVYQPHAGWLSLFLRVMLASLLMSLLLIWMQGDLSVWTSASSSYKVGQLLLLIVVGVLVYFISLILLRVDLKGLLLGRAAGSR